MKSSMSLTDFFLLTCYLGLVIFLIGAIIFAFFIYKYGKKKRGIFIYRTVISVFLQLLISVFLSMFIWKYWPFNIDVMFGFVLIPALIAEMISVPLFCFFRKLAMFH